MLIQGFLTYFFYTDTTFMKIGAILFEISWRQTNKHRWKHNHLAEAVIITRPVVHGYKKFGVFLGPMY